MQITASAYDFDTAPYFTTAANDLIRLHGRDAMIHAARAIEKMKTMGHREGFFMWRQIESALKRQILCPDIPANVTRH